MLPAFKGIVQRYLMHRLRICSSKQFIHRVVTNTGLYNYEENVDENSNSRMDISIAIETVRFRLKYMVTHRCTSFHPWTFLFVADYLVEYKLPSKNAAWLMSHQETGRIDLWHSAFCSAVMSDSITYASCHSWQWYDVPGTWHHDIYPCTYDM